MNLMPGYRYFVLVPGIFLLFKIQFALCGIYPMVLPQICIDIKLGFLLQCKKFDIFQTVRLI